MNSRAFLARAVVALTLAVGLVACKDNTGDKSSFQGSGIVKLVDTRILPSSDSSNVISAGSASYVLAKMEITNDQTTDWTPDLTHVFLLDRLQNRYPAITSGTTALLGVSNDGSPIKKGEKRTYTVAFRVTDPTITGTIGYDF